MPVSKLYSMYLAYKEKFPEEIIFLVNLIGGVQTYGEDAVKVGKALTIPVFSKETQDRNHKYKFAGFSIEDLRENAAKLQTAGYTVVVVFW